MKTRKLLLSMLLTLLATSLRAQEKTDLRQLDEKSRTEYLTTLAEEMTRNLGPDFYKKYDKDRGPAITRLKDNGRAFYRVVLIPKGVGDKTQFTYYKIDLKTKKREAKTRLVCASQVTIWEDDGQPRDIFFGNNLGRVFKTESYWQMLERRISKAEQINSIEIDNATTTNGDTVTVTFQ